MRIRTFVAGRLAGNIQVTSRHALKSPTLLLFIKFPWGKCRI